MAIWLDGVDHHCDKGRGTVECVQPREAISSSAC